MIRKLGFVALGACCLTVLSCSSGSSSKSTPLSTTIPQSLSMPAVSGPALSDQDYATAKTFLLSSTFSSSNFDIDDYVFCPSADQSGLTSDQKQLLTDIQANCNIQNTPTNSAPDQNITIGSTYSSTSVQSIVAKTAQSACPVTESNNSSFKIQITDLDPNAQIAKGTGPLDVVTSRTLNTQEAKTLLQDNLQLKADGTVSTQIDSSGQTIYSAFSLNGSVQPSTGPASIGVSGELQVLSANFLTTQMSILLTFSQPNTTNSLTIAMLIHGYGNGTPTIDSMTVGGHAVTGDDLTSFQNSGLTEIFKSFQSSMNSNSCGN